MRPSGAAGTHWGFFWICVFWFNIASCFSANDLVNLQTTDGTYAQCGDNVILTCNASSPQPWNLNIKKFVWQFGNTTMCQFGADQDDDQFKCESTNTTFNRIIFLTLYNVMPTNEGNYLCKLYSTSGSWNGGSQLRAEECLESTEASSNENYAECSFDGVYPSGEVHWFQGDTNVTEEAYTHKEKDESERFNIRSVMNLKNNGLGEPYNCSLWIPSLGRYIATEEVSSGGSVRLQWIWLVVSLMMSFIV
ncbi:uncharacterized protein [Nothobranchius furzeri]|uniref:LOC107376704-like protein n=1 Tax=Nothobranchius furzeri TaxID=105023 RepID=A0A9D2YJE4_NOTFU|nr:uncharacterized protein LOC107376704 [Nothobranchius furzeri]KAF7221248.1 putative LOC107376704-like protein [Nothobranchius furzeri]